MKVKQWACQIKGYGKTMGIAVMLLPRRTCAGKLDEGILVKSIRNKLNTKSRKMRSRSHTRSSKKKKAGCHALVSV